MNDKKENPKPTGCFMTRAVPSAGTGKTLSISNEEGRVPQCQGRGPVAVGKTLIFANFCQGRKDSLNRALRAENFLPLCVQFTQEALRINMLAWELGRGCMERLPQAIAP